MSLFPYLIVVPLLGLISVAVALNVLWLAPIAALLGLLCGSRKRADYVRGGHVVVTGGGSGIGLAVAQQCAQGGARQVTLIGRNLERLEAAKKEVVAAGDGHCEVVTVSMDLRQASQSEVCAALGVLASSVDLLVCSAGDSGQPEILEKITEESWEAMYGINVLGSVKVANAVLPGMKIRNKGMVCLIGSMASQIGIYGLSAYTASKFAVRGFAECLRMELAATDVRVNLVCPPDVDTPMYRREMETKPLVCQKISEGAGLWKAGDIANGILRGVNRRDFVTGFGIDGFMLNTITGGMYHAESPLNAVCEVLLLPLFRLIGMFYQNKFDGIVCKYSAPDPSIVAGME